MEQVIRLEVNGRLSEPSVSPEATLADVLRQLGYLGVHIGCGLGQCGACTGLLDGRSVKSCLVLALQADGLSVTTVEGLAREDGTPHPLQEAFSRNFAVQCGFCTPGMLLAAKALLDCDPQPTEERIRDWLAGNLCRCTGYVNIVKAIQEAAQVLAKEGVE